MFRFIPFMPTQPYKNFRVFTKCLYLFIYLFSKNTYAVKPATNVIMQIERGAMGTKCQMSGTHFQTLVGWR